jgi:hypothetical protein
MQYYNYDKLLNGMEWTNCKAKSNFWCDRCVLL